VIEYYVIFPALKMSRHQVVGHVRAVLDEHRISLDDEADCEEIVFDTKLQRYQWTGRTVSVQGLDDALTRSQSWQGLVLYFRYVIQDVLGELSVVLWNDAEPGVTTLALCESSTLFNLQREQAHPWSDFQRLLIRLMASLQASFCFMQCEPPLRTLGNEMIHEVLERIRKGRLVPILLAIQVERFTGAAALADFVLTGCMVRREHGYLIISDPRMGTPESDD
jgi:hypothetical protein